VYYYHKDCKTLYSTGKALFLFVSQCHPSCLHSLAESVWWLDLDFLSLTPGMWDGQWNQRACTRAFIAGYITNWSRSQKQLSFKSSQGTYFVVDLWLPLAASKNISAFSNFETIVLQYYWNNQQVHPLLLAADASEVSEYWWLLEGRATWQIIIIQEGVSSFNNCILGAMNTFNYMYLRWTCHTSVTRNL